MNARERGLRRIRLLTWGMSVLGVAGSIGVAGLARAATTSAGNATPDPSPSPTSTATRHPHPRPTHSTRPPVITHTDDPPIIISGGS
jgi:hypothetical protein